MKKLLPFIGLLATVAFLNLSCEKDDICPEGTLTTSRLIVRFYDATLPNEVKTVSSLAVYGLNDANEEIFFNNIESLDSIAIPLRTDANLTRLVFHKDITDLGDLGTGNADNTEISYIREDQYVSRACGYKTNFVLQSTNLITDTDNWITNIEINIDNATVENETTAHIKIFH